MIGGKAVRGLVKHHCVRWRSASYQSVKPFKAKCYALKAMTVDHGLAGGQPGTEAAYRVITTLRFDSVDAYQKAFMPHAAEIQGDIPRFTNIAPTVQISEVKI